LVVRVDLGQWAPIWRETGDHRGGIREAALCQADYPPLGAAYLLDRVAVRASEGLVPSGFDSDDVCGHRPDGECRGDPADDILRVH
jgi:hypothetical protein